MNIDQAIKIIETHMEVHKIGEYPHVIIGQALNMAIDALRDQQTPIKLDRSRWKQCEQCRPGGQLELDAYCEWSYCPYCGLPLTEEAWVTLERKVLGETKTAPVRGRLDLHQ